LRLETVARKVRSDLTALGFAVEGEPESPFLFVRTAGEMRALIAARKLLGQGILVKPITFAGSRREAGLVAILTVLHDERDLTQLIASFARLGGGLSMSSLSREFSSFWRKGSLAASRVDRRLSDK
jgi:7-keto-8-aminopelargonate synthetase-like enzyme